MATKTCTGKTAPSVRMDTLAEDPRTDIVVMNDD
jgi:hypothetical protein